MRLSLVELLEGFPALDRIGETLQNRRRVPVVLQMAMLDCGAACLSMVLAYFGKRVGFEEVRERVGVTRDGASAKGIVDAARHFGLRPRAIKVELDDLPDLPRGSVLHWDFNHFVVFEGVDGGYLEIVDPAQGRRKIAVDAARTSMTGIALMFEPAEHFVAGTAGRNAVYAALTGSLREDRRWVRVVVVATLMQLFALGLPVLMGVVADRVIPRGDEHLLAVLCVGVVGICVFNYVAALIRAHLLLEFRTTMDVRLSVTLIEHMASLPFSFFARRRAGDLMMRLNSNAAIRDILTASTLSALVDGTMVLGYLLLLLVAAPSFGLLVVGLGAMQVVTFLIARPRLESLGAEQLHMQTRTQAYQAEMLVGMKTLKAMGVERDAVERWNHYFVDASNVAITRGRLSALVDATQNVLRLASPLVTLVVGTILVLQSDMSLGAMLGVQALAIGVLNPITNLMSAGDQLLLLRSYLERMDDVLSTAAEQDDARVMAPTSRLSGRIRLDRVNFRYAELLPMVLRDVSVEIEPGQFVAIVGPSGCGKTTLASLLLALHRPTSGSIYYDGIDLSTLDVRAVRRQMGVVLQSPYVFGESLRYNIGMAQPDLPLERVVEAAAAAQIHDDIAAMGMGYETLVSDAGGSLSGGQRQRIALARALVHRPSIILLDEATSALDGPTEARVQETIAQLGCTRVVIAHRLSTVVDADLILVMKDGEIVERGVHHDLLRRRGAYYELVLAQLAEVRAARRVEAQLQGVPPPPP